MALSCVKPYSDAIYYNGDFSVKTAKQWYDGNKSKFDQLINVDIFKTDNYKPLWDQARISEDSLYEVIEIPLVFVKSIGINTKNSQNKSDTSNMASLTKLLVLKNKISNELDGAFMNIIFSNRAIDYNIGYDNSTRKNFSGNIFYTKLNGEFINGWMYDGGVIKKSTNAVAAITNNLLTPKSNNVSGQKSAYLMSSGSEKIDIGKGMHQNIPTSALNTTADENGCVTEVVDWYERFCWNGSCTGWIYLHSDYYPYCNYTTSDGGGGGYTSNPPAEPPQKNPCDNADSLENNNEYKEKFDSLKNKTSDTKEHGYIYKSNGSGGIDETPIVGEDGAAGIGFTVPDKIDGFIHSHYTGLLSVFSPDDLFAMATLYITDKMVNPSTFTAGVVTANGTQYIIMIDDLTKFQQFASNMVNNSTLDAYSFTFEMIYGITPSNNNEANEKAFLQYIQQTNSGLKLFKGDANFTDWQPKKVDGNGNVVNNPC